MPDFARQCLCGKQAPEVRRRTLSPLSVLKPAQNKLHSIGAAPARVSAWFTTVALRPAEHNASLEHPRSALDCGSSCYRFSGFGVESGYPSTLARFAYGLRAESGSGCYRSPRRPSAAITSVPWPSWPCRGTGKMPVARHLGKGR
jgi:hypothetical protein